MYEVLWKGSPVGKATIAKEGLFYRVVCNCYLPREGTYRVKITDGNNECNLGICVPDGNMYSCTARVSCKRFNGNSFSFVLTAPEDNLSVPIGSGTPFMYLDRLSTARLQFTNGQPNIIIAPSQAPQDNDLNPIHLHKSAQR